MGSYLFIIGHVSATITHPETEIRVAANPIDALRQYNNSLRGPLSYGSLCVLIYVPAERHLDVPALSELWHKSRKLFCRMRFGIYMAYDLGLPCFVSSHALEHPHAHKAMPHIVSRVEEMRALANGGAVATAVATDDDGDDVPSGKRAKNGRAKAGRRRARRPSAYDASVAEYPVIIDSNSDSLLDVLSAHVQRQERAATTTTTDVDERDRRNTLEYKEQKICFTLRDTSEAPNGAQHDSSGAQLTTIARRRIARARATSTTVVVAATTAAAEGSAASTVPANSVAARTKRKRRRSVIATTAGSVTDAGNALYGADEPLARSVVDSIRDELDANDGVLDNQRLVERVDDLYSDALEYDDRAMIRLRPRRHANHCFNCGGDTVVSVPEEDEEDDDDVTTATVVDGAANRRRWRRMCAVCGRSPHSVRLYHTDVSLLKERVLRRPCSGAERREIKKLMAQVESTPPVEVYGKATSAQLRLSLAQATKQQDREQQQQQQQLQVPLPKASTMLLAPAETQFIENVFRRFTVAGTRAVAV